MNKITSLSLVAVLMASMGAPCAADTGSATADAAGQKLDSGLGELPHYSQWADPSGKTPLLGAARKPDAKGHQIAGEKLDSGLGDLPHFSRWGQRDGGQARQVAQAK